MKKTAIAPIAPVLVRNLVLLAKTYARIKGIKIETVGANSRKTANFYVDLEAGKLSCSLKTYDAVTAWFCEEWPAGHDMPRLEDPLHHPNSEQRPRASRPMTEELEAMIDKHGLSHVLIGLSLVCNVRTA